MIGVPGGDPAKHGLQDRACYLLLYYIGNFRNVNDDLFSWADATSYTVTNRSLAAAMASSSMVQVYDMAWHRELGVAGRW